MTHCAIAATHPAADGHFPGNPIMPGAVLLGEIVAAIEQAGGLRISAIRLAKFLKPVRPGDQLSIRWRHTKGELLFEALRADECALTGALTLKDVV